MLEKRVLSAWIIAVFAVLAAAPVAHAAPKRSPAKGRSSSVEKVSPKARGSRPRAKPAAHGGRSRAPARPATTTAPPRAAGTTPRAARSGAGSDLQEAILADSLRSPGGATGAADKEPAAESSTTLTSAPTPAPARSSDFAPPAFAGAPSRDRAEPAPAPPPRRRVTIGLNPLPIVAGRYGLNAELVVARHHAIVASAWLQTFTPAMLRVIMPEGVDVSRGANASFGGELGYRFYTGRDGAHGFFGGVSGVAMPIVYPRVTQSLESEVVSFNAYGAALDIGAQAITSSGFTIGGGIGVMYLAYTPPPSEAPPSGARAAALPEPHVLPRLLLAVGWSF